ncbi:MAG: response regulator [Polyangiaceae bacterium]
MDARVLIADDDTMVARLLQQALQKAGYRVDVVADGMAARERLVSGCYQVLVTDWMMPELDGIELVRLVRARREPCCVVLITELNIPAARSHAVQQGADDFFTKPVVAAEVVQSVTRWFEKRKVVAGSSKVVPPPRGKEGAGSNDGADGVHPIARTTAWGGLPSAIRKVLADTVQVPLVEGPPWERAPDGSVIGHLVLIDVEHLLEFHVAIEAPRESALVMARAMLGDADPDDLQTVRDLVSEMANMVAGTVKSSFLPDGFSFTLGIAKNTEQATIRYDAARVVRLDAGGIEVVVRCGVRPRNSLVVLPTQLHEGMVLAENALSSSGGLLLPAGTRLTRMAADRLRDALKGRQVKVCIPDGVAA